MQQNNNNNKHKRKRKKKHGVVQKNKKVKFKDEVEVASNEFKENQEPFRPHTNTNTNTKCGGHDWSLFIDHKDTQEINRFKIICPLYVIA